MQQLQQNKWLNWYLKNSDAVLLVLAVLDLFILAVSFFDKRVDNYVFSYAWQAFVSGMFAVDFILKYAIASDKKGYIKEQWWQIIVIFFPFLRAIRIFLRIFVLSYRIRDNIRILLVERGLAILFAFMVVVALIFSIVILIIEKSSPHANITTIDKAIWWAFSTISTVGYGDAYPVTILGKVVAITLMFVGLGLVAVFTAQFAAMIIESDREINKEEMQELTAIRKDLAQTKAELKQVKQVLQKLLRK
jgi:voltage-gated potassium channel